MTDFYRNVAQKPSEQVTPGKNQFVIFLAFAFDGCEYTLSANVVCLKAGTLQQFLSINSNDINVNSVFVSRELTVFNSLVFVAGATTPTQKRHPVCVCFTLLSL